MSADGTMAPLSVAETTQLAVAAAILLQVTVTIGTGCAVTVTVVVAVPETLPPVAVTFAVKVPAVGYVQIVVGPAVVAVAEGERVTENGSSVDQREERLLMPA
jgi:hypothetical protein